MSRHVLMSRLGEQFAGAPSSPSRVLRYPSPERSLSPRCTQSPPRSPDSLMPRPRLDLFQFGDMELAGHALKQYAQATGKLIMYLLLLLIFSRHND